MDVTQNTTITIQNDGGTIIIDNKGITINWEFDKPHFLN